MNNYKFEVSELLGPRAEYVYTWFKRSLHLPGAVAECGVYSGKTSREFVRYLETHDIDKTVHMFDTFQGIPDIITDEEKTQSTWPELQKEQYSYSIESVLRNMDSLHQYETHVGLFSDTFDQFFEPLCFIHSDGDLYQSTIDTIGLADRLLVPNGHIVFDDYNNPRLPGIKLAIERYLDPQSYVIAPSLHSIQCFPTKR